MNDMEDIAEYRPSRRRGPALKRKAWVMEDKADESELVGQTLQWIGEAVVEGRKCVLLDAGGERMWAIAANGRASVRGLVGLLEDAVGSPLTEFSREDFAREEGGKETRWAKYSMATGKGTAVFCYRLPGGSEASLRRVVRKEVGIRRWKAMASMDLENERREFAERCLRFSRSWGMGLDAWARTDRDEAREWRALGQAVAEIPAEEEGAY